MILYFQGGFKFPHCLQQINQSSLIDAVEGREAVTVDIPNAFIQAVVEDKKVCIIICIWGYLVDVHTRIAPKIYNFITSNARGKKQILVQCLNTLYGTMVASLLDYHKFTNSLKKHRFSMNPCDSCVWNKLVEGKQLTICFHVDNCKFSHIFFPSIRRHKIQCVLARPWLWKYIQRWA